MHSPEGSKYLKPKGRQAEYRQQKMMLPRSAPSALRRFGSRAFGTRYSAPSARRISRLGRSILAFPLLLIYEMTTAIYQA